MQRSDGTYNAPEKVVVGGKAVNFADLDGALSDTVVEGISTPGKTGISPADTADNNRSVLCSWRYGRYDPMSEATDFAGPDPATTQLTTVHGEQRRERIFRPK